MGPTTNWKQQLSNAALDKKVGIRIANLSDDSDNQNEVNAFACLNSHLTADRVPCGDLS